VPRAKPVTEAVVDAEPAAATGSRRLWPTSPTAAAVSPPRSSRGRPDVNEVKAVLAGIWFVVVLTW